MINILSKILTFLQDKYHINPFIVALVIIGIIVLIARDLSKKNGADKKETSLVRLGIIGVVAIILFFASIIFLFMCSASTGCGGLANLMETVIGWIMKI